MLEQGAPTGGLDLVIDDSNRATVAWGASAVRAAVTDATATFGAAQEIAPGAEGALASTPDGRRLVAWTSGGTLLAALAPVSGPFGAAETVAATADAPYAAFDATGNRWWLVWGATTPQASQRPAG